MQKLKQCEITIKKLHDEAISFILMTEKLD